MADKIVVKVKPWVGEYPFDLEDKALSTLEWRWIKQLSGYLPLTVGDGVRGADPSLYCAFAVIAMARAGRIDKTEVLRVAEKLDDAPVDGASIAFVSDEQDVEDGDVGPPDLARETVQPNTNGGPSSSSISDPQDSIPLATGHPV